MKCNNILDAIGRTPLVRLNRINQGLKPQIYVKADYINPGGSVKDRIGITMIDDAEKKGLLKPGGTIIEGTSGNTGMGLALVAAVRGYKMVFTITDKQSKEKVDLLKALGAEVIVCPTAVEPDDPRSYYSVAKKLAREIPNSFYPNQYDNPMNPEAHYRTTGPEIWDDSEGKITHFVCGMGTGGTISGVGKYLKEKNPKVQIIGVDPIGSLYYDFVKRGETVKAQDLRGRRHRRGFFPHDDESEDSRRRAASERRRVLHHRAPPGKNGRACSPVDPAAAASPRRCAWRRISARKHSSSRFCPTPACATSARSTTTSGCASAATSTPP